jgi:uncharacterized protein YjdB
MRVAVLLAIATISLAACDTALTTQLASAGPGGTGGSNDSCAVQAVIVTPDSITLKVGQTLQPSARVQSCTVSANEGVRWVSSDSTIAAVDATFGFITARRVGTVTIVASAVADPSVRDAIAVTVSP